MTLVGQKLGVYEVVAKLGEGGMGQVYRARDSKLHRDVAIKVLPTDVAYDGDRLLRFEREAQILASLNHPNIAAIYGVEEAMGAPALVMELVEGPTLADRIVQGPLPIDEALSIAEQIAGALEAAHEQGIIHRDLKPANIKVRPDGAVKVLDFGLAKVFDPAASSSSSAANSPTISVHGTRAGIILGTAGYMAPEQARGRAVDRRADIWAFGVIVYEMLSGTRLFGGEETSETLALVFTSEPDWGALPTNTPAPIRRLLRRSLDKDPKRRLASAADARLEIDDALGDSVADAQPPARAVVRSTRLWQAIAGVAALTTLVVSTWLLRPTAQSASRVDLLLPDGAARSEFVSLSPDGRNVLVAVPGSGLWVRDFASLDWRRLPGTENGGSPFWSPDGRYVGFAAGSQLKKVDTSGGPPETLCTVPTIAIGSGSWNRDGVIVFGSWGGGAGGPIWKVSQAGGAATPVTEVNTSRGELYHTWPTFLEDGTHFLYFRSGPTETAGIYAGALDTTPAEQSQARILASELTPAYANGYLFFMRATTMMAQAFDRGRLQVTGAPVAIADAIRTTWYGTEVFSVSSGGTLAYATAPRLQNGQLTWFDRQGKSTAAVGPPSLDGAVTLSPDGKRATVRDADYDVPGDLWTVDLSSGARTRLTFQRNDYSPGVWSPDGTRIAYAGGNLGDTVYVKASSGTSEAIEMLKEPGTRHFVTSWSRDGRFLLYHTENAPKTGYDVWTLPAEGSSQPVLLLGDSFNEWAAQFSPDGHWIVYASTETGDAELFVRPFTVTASGKPAIGEGKWQVSKDGGNWPVWRGDREILFTNGLPWLPGTTLMATAVKSGANGFESGIPERLFASDGGAGWDATADGQRFLVPVRRMDRPVPASLSLILNWPALLKK